MIPLTACNEFIINNVSDIPSCQVVLQLLSSKHLSLSGQKYTTEKPVTLFSIQYVSIMKTEKKVACGILMCWKTCICLFHICTLNVNGHHFFICCHFFEWSNFIYNFGWSVYWFRNCWCVVLSQHEFFSSMRLIFSISKMFSIVFCNNIWAQRYKRMTLSSIWLL